MMLLNDEEIRAWGEEGGISPFSPNQIREIHEPDGSIQKILSLGTSSFGYDATLAPSFKMVTPVLPSGKIPVMDPKDPDPNIFVDIETDVLIMPPHSFALGCTRETFDMPVDVLGMCFGKSTMARCGLVVIVTPLEPGWQGQVTLELVNNLPIPVKVYANEGICQFVFLRGKRPSVTYADRAGKYQNQVGVVTSRI